MPKTGADVLITDLARRIDLDAVDATTRVDLLRWLNVQQKAICQDHSLQFLVTSANLAVVASAIAVPSTIDDSKAMTIGRPTASGDGEVVYVPADEWFLVRVDTYPEVSVPTVPTHYTRALVAGVNTFLFKPTGLTATLPYLAQALVTDMTDAGGSKSVLPEGWEDTLLLDYSEMEWRRINNQPRWQELEARVNDKKERLYSSYRTTKEKPMTDREQKERKVAQSLRDEA